MKAAKLSVGRPLSPPTEDKENISCQTGQVSAKEKKLAAMLDQKRELKAHKTMMEENLQEMVSLLFCGNVMCDQVRT